MNDNEKISGWIDRFNRGDLHGDELKQFSKLLSGNPELRREILVDRDLENILADEDLLDFREKLLEPLKTQRSSMQGLKLLSFAASILLFSGLVMVLIFYARRDNTRESLPASGFRPEKTAKPEMEDSALLITGNEIPKDRSVHHWRPVKAHKPVRERYAASYRPYPPFETLAGSGMRSPSFFLRLPDRTVFSPKDTIRFEWDRFGNDPYRLYIMDNKGKVVHAGPGADSTTCFVKAGDLRFGRFYFKIVSGDQLVHFGTFEVE